MCILINHPANTNFDRALLDDFFSYNSDGFGAMYAENGELKIIKIMGTPNEIAAIYERELAHRDCVIHYRMRTHGATDLDNCHPYKVTDNIWLAHNGILSTGNPVHTHKSDTWHFIEYLLRPALTAHPELMFNAEFQAYLAEMIGPSNKFALMDGSGKAVIINEEAGVTHMGAWLSNTYAWSSHKHGHGYASKYYTSAYDSFDTNGEAYGSYGTAYGKYGSTKQSSKALGWEKYEDEVPVGEIRTKTFNYDRVLRAAYNCYRRGSGQLLDWVIAVPEKAEFLLLEWYGEAYDQEMAEIVNADPEEAVLLISNLFSDGSVSEADVI